MCALERFQSSQLQLTHTCILLAQYAYVGMDVCVRYVESNLLTMLLKTELKRRDAALFVNVVGVVNSKSSGCG